MVYRSFLIDHRFFGFRSISARFKGAIIFERQNCYVESLPYTSLFVRTNGVLRVKFAYRADAGTTLYFGIKDAFGNVIEKKS